MTEERIITPGVSDEEFIRGKVPMTKREVRVASICKLHLKENSVFYDIGSGSGSVSVEAARLSKDIKVFAVDLNAEAVELTKQNAEKFGLENITVIKGAAPDILEELPPPDCVFIGGSSGYLEEILTALYSKNPKVRVVVNAVSLESLSLIERVVNRNEGFKLKDFEAVQFSVTKAEEAGRYHLFKANNPVFIVSFNFEK